jgi:protein-L-isoaspartate(D-aspartate) O-methyltransferase
MAEPDFAALRRDMVEQQIRARGIDDQRLLDAFQAVPRELFVPGELRHRVYDDGPLPIGNGQTISQPYIVALMIAAADIGTDDRILEVGAGSGYAAAVIGHVAKEVVALERIAALADQARGRIEALGLSNVAIVCGDGSRGWPDVAPFDAILVAAAAIGVPRALLDQLRCPGGRLVIPVGSAGGNQRLISVERTGEDEFVTTDLGGVRFVPLVSDQ